MSKSVMGKKAVWVGTLPETNSELTPRNGWLERRLFPFWGFGLLSGV